MFSGYTVVLNIMGEEEEENYLSNINTTAKSWENLTRKL